MGCHLSPNGHGFEKRKFKKERSVCERQGLHQSKSSNLSSSRLRLDRTNTKNQYGYSNRIFSSPLLRQEAIRLSTVPVSRPVKDSSDGISLPYLRLQELYYMLMYYNQLISRQGTDPSSPFD